MTQPPEKPIPPAKIKFDAQERRAESHPYPIEKVPDRGRIRCEECGEFKPFDKFDDGTDSQCSACRRFAAERELNEIRAREMTKFSQELTKAGKATGPKQLQHVEHFIAEMLHNAGGMEIFAKMWWDHLQQGMEARPGSAGILDQFRSIAKLMMDVNKLQHQESVLDMSDQQLRAKKELAMVSLLADAAGDPGNRQMLFGVMRSAGLDVQEIPGAITVQEAPHAFEQA